MNRKQSHLRLLLIFNPVPKLFSIELSKPKIINKCPCMFKFEADQYW